MTEVAAPVIAGLSLVDEEARARIRAAAMAAAGPFEVDGRVELPLDARCIVGTRWRVGPGVVSSGRGAGS